MVERYIVSFRIILAHDREGLPKKRTPVGCIARKERIQGFPNQRSDGFIAIVGHFIQPGRLFLRELYLSSDHVVSYKFIITPLL